MIPTRHDYYRRRAREHRRLALVAQGAEERAMHDRLVAAYNSLARRYMLREVVTLRG